MHLKSVCLCELWQEGEAYEKTARLGAPSPFSFPAAYILPHSFIP
jgi:hypothetical protein